VLDPRVVGHDRPASRAPAAGPAGPRLALRLLADGPGLPPRGSERPRRLLLPLRRLSRHPLRTSHAPDGAVLSRPPAGRARRPRHRGTQGGLPPGCEHRGLRGGEPARGPGPAGGAGHHGHPAVAPRVRATAPVRPSSP
jgi:hypothetical protein